MAGRDDSRTAILSMTFDKLRNGESNINPFISYEYISANIIEHIAPILLPHNVTLPTFTIFLIYCSISLISKTSFIPYVKVSGSLLPQPGKSKAAILILNFGINWTKGMASSLLPPFP